MATITDTKTVGRWDKVMVVRVRGTETKLVFPFVRKSRLTTNVRFELAFQITGELDAIRRENNMPLGTVEENAKIANNLAEYDSFIYRDVELEEYKLTLDTGETKLMRDLSAHHTGMHGYQASQIRLMAGV